MKVIAFSGRARVGKSHITNTLARALWDSGKYIPVVLPLSPRGASIQRVPLRWRCSA